jgi:phosphoglycerate dehydrogenase-like enzyme
MAEKHQVLFLTQRGLWHQNQAISAAPSEFDVIMRREPTRAEISSIIPKVDFLISERAGVIDADLIEKAGSLKLIQRLGRQTWDIDLDAAKKMGVPVCCLPIAGCQLVAEHMILHALALIKQIREVVHIAETASDEWGRPKECTEDYFAYNWSGRKAIGGLFGKTVGILGFGEIGVEIALRLCGFDCEVIYNKRNPLPPHAEELLKIKYAELAEIQAESDVIINLLPDFPKTYHFLDATFYQRCKRGAILVHAGGGTTVDPEATKQALLSGQLFGASLDTFNWEPIRSDDPLVSLAQDKDINLLLTPHIAAGAMEGEAHSRAYDYINLVAYLKDEPLKFRVV